MNDISKAAHYRSFYEVSKMLDNDAKLEFYVALDEYRFDGVEPVFKTHDALLAFTAIKPILDADIKRKNGGAPKGNHNATKQPKNNTETTVENNLKTTEKQPIDFFENNLENNIKTTVVSKKSNNVNVNDNVNVNVNVNDNGSTDRLTDGDIKKLNSDSVHDYLQILGYDCSMTSCGQIASILNNQKFELDYIKFVENKVSDRYPDISPSLMVNALTTWIELFDDYRKERKTKEKKKVAVAPLQKCVVCGDSLNSQNWINGKFHAYFCTKCMTNFENKNGSWVQTDELTA